MSATIINEKEGMSLKKTQKGIWQGLEGGNGNM